MIAPPPALFSSGCQSVPRACSLHRPVAAQVSLEWAERREAGLGVGPRRNWAAACHHAAGSRGPAHTPGCVAAAASVCMARSSEFGDPGGRKKERPTLRASGAAAVAAAAVQGGSPRKATSKQLTLGRQLCLG